MRKRLISLSIVLSLLAGLVVLSGGTEALAYGPSDPDPAFNPNNLISDSQMTASGSSSGADVQGFLVGKGSWLKDYTIPEYARVFYQYRDGGNCVTGETNVRQYNDVTNHALYGMKVSELIHREAAEHGINAQVMLVTLEKESTAISRTTEKSWINTSWILGYGYDESLAACNYTQQAAIDRANLLGGIGQQIAYATAWFQSRMASANLNPMPINDAPGGYIYPATRATSVLYKYTPHIFNGNYNFWSFFNAWFGAPVLSPTIIVRDTADGVVYVVVSGIRYPVDSLSTLFHMGLSGHTIHNITTQYYEMPVGPTVKRLLLSPQGNVTYILDGTRHDIASARIFEARGFKWSDLSAPNPIFWEIPQGLPYYEIAKRPNHPAVYIMSNSRGYAFQDAPTYLDGWGFSWGDVGVAENYAFAPFPLDGKVTRLIKGSGPAVYFMDKGTRYPIPSSDMFNRWRFGWGDVMNLDDRFIAEFPVGRSLSQVVKGSGSAVYLIEGGQKKPFASMSVLTRRGFRTGDVITMSDSFLGGFPTGATLR